VAVLVSAGSRRSHRQQLARDAGIATATTFCQLYAAWLACANVAIWSGNSRSAGPDHQPEREAMPVPTQRLAGSSRTRCGRKGRATRKASGTGWQRSSRLCASSFARQGLCMQRDHERSVTVNGSGVPCAVPNSGTQRRVPFGTVWVKNLTNAEAESLAAVALPRSLHQRLHRSNDHVSQHCLRLLRCFERL